MRLTGTRSRRLTAVMAVLLSAALPSEADEAAEDAPRLRSGYAPVNGLKMYYEIHGAVRENEPPLVLIGDRDIVRPEHAVLMFRLLPNAQLAVLPGTDHMTIVNRSDLLVSMIGAFLDSPMPPARPDGMEKR
jgi:pimeloyl-ACP methyl ester carboxylesterase